MTKSKAIAIFLEIYSDRFTDEEKADAIRTVVASGNLRSVTKDEMLGVIAYLAGIKQADTPYH